LLVKQILKSLRKVTINHAMPVYNLNWFENTRFYKRILGDATITLADVGARNFSVEELKPLQRHINYIGFDADSEEVKRLNLQKSLFKTSKFITSFVGVKGESIKFGIHHIEGESSRFPFAEYYSNWFRGGKKNYIKKYIELQSSSLDELTDDEDIDFIKLDTQGTEYEILKNAKKCLKSSLMVECEVEFIEVYKGQNLAHDIFELMHKLGFELLYLNRIFGQSSHFAGNSRGQMIFADALFGISRENALKLSLTKKVKYIALLLNYGHIDFAFDIYSNCKDLQEKTPFLKDYFVKKNKKNKLSTIFKILIDKIIFVLLVLRKTNGIGTDSDRSWPIR